MFPMRVSDWKRHKKCFSVHADTAATYLPTYTYELLTLISNVCARGLHTCLSLPLSHRLFLLKIGMLVFKHWQAANYGLIRTSFLRNPPRFGGTAKKSPKTIAFVSYLLLTPFSKVSSLVLSLSLSLSMHVNFNPFQSNQMNHILRCECM